jgi:hypothetical protein
MLAAAALVRATQWRGPALPPPQPSAPRRAVLPASPTSRDEPGTRPAAPPASPAGGAPAGLGASPRPAAEGPDARPRSAIEQAALGTADRRRLRRIESTLEAERAQVQARLAAKWLPTSTVARLESIAEGSGEDAAAARDLLGLLGLAKPRGAPKGGPH